MVPAIDLRLPPAYRFDAKIIIVLYLKHLTIDISYILNVDFNLTSISSIDFQFNQSKKHKIEKVGESLLT